LNDSKILCNRNEIILLRVTTQKKKTTCIQTQNDTLHIIQFGQFVLLLIKLYLHYQQPSSEPGTKPQTLKEKLRTRYALLGQVHRTLPEEVTDDHREMVRIMTAREKSRTLAEGLPYIQSPRNEHGVPHRQMSLKCLSYDTAYLFMKTAGVCACKSLVDIRPILTASTSKESAPHVSPKTAFSPFPRNSIH